MIKEYMRGYRATHVQLSTSIPKEIADPFRKQLAIDGLSLSQFIRLCINLYMKGWIVKDDVIRDKEEND